MEKGWWFKLESLNKKELEQSEEAMETLTSMDDPQEGMKWIYPKCIDCIFAKGAHCAKFGTDRMNAPFDIYDCPAFKSKTDEKKQAFELMGVDK